ncbi:PQQ-dependent sugar dehydrogenase [Patulibacter sp. SYSU D01012]|uniref:PQQ-dependent sugar dehydrogenase n=1 Tax=Patulibacter sp. SYSU D01012 TaxID=2817381 RepID=UPI001B3070A2|nr:PQQ-dependent sugar dehydrogenase [Patulibacter sp. SYSU D01012]
MSRAPAATLPLLALAAAAVAGCGEEPASAPARPTPPAAAQLSPQRVLDAPTLRVRPVATEFRRAVELVREPGARGRILVLEQRGTARWLDGARPAKGAPFLDIRGTVLRSEEQGLLGLAFLPGYAREPRVAVHYTDTEGDSQVAIYRVRNGHVDPLSARPVLRVEQPYANHNGGELVVGPDDLLYLGMGDGGSAFDPRQKAQDPRSPLGKILRMDPAEDRPRWRRVALGLRNPWRLSFDARTGALWVADAGRDSAEQQTEEIDRIPARRLRGRAETNFGWAAFEGGREQQNRRLSRTGTLSWPIASYTQRDGCSATGGLALRGGDGPRALRGRYVFGDICSGIVWSIPADAGGGATMRREGVRVPNQTSYAVDRDGRLLVSTLGGRVVELRDRAR